MRKAVRYNSLGIVFGLLFLVCLAGQAIAGHIAYNSEQLEHGGEAISLGRYLTSSDFGQAVMENWQSEYLQFLVFLMLTVWRCSAARRSRRSPSRRALSPTRSR